MQDDAFGFSMQGVVSMIAALYELEEEDQESSTGMSPGMLVKRSSELAKGLEVVKSEIASMDDNMETADDASEMAAAVYDLNRVIGMLQDLSHLDREDVKKREKELMKSFHDIKRDIKDILESLNSLEKTKDGKIRTKSRRSRQSDREEMKQEQRTFDIRVDLDDVLAMITALGIAEDDEDEAESILTPKDIKARSQKLAQLLPGVLARLETFLETSSYSGAASEAYGVTELIECHVVVLKRILDVVDAVCGARDANEVELAVYRTYNSFQGLQREAREVLTSIYSIQLGEQPPTPKSPKPTSPKRDEMKDADSKDGGLSDVGVSKASDVQRKATFNLPSADAFQKMDFGFDMSFVLGMLVELGEDDETATAATPEELRNKTSMMATTLERVLDAVSSPLRLSFNHDAKDDDKDAADVRKRFSSMDEAVFDLQRVLSLLTDLINADDEDLERVLNRNGSFQSIKDDVRGALQRVMSATMSPVGNIKADSAAQAKDADDRPDSKATSK